MTNIIAGQPWSGYVTIFKTTSVGWFNAAYQNGDSLTANINWGDGPEGSPDWTAAVLHIDPVGSGLSPLDTYLAPVVSHTYATKGTYTPQIMIEDSTHSSTFFYPTESNLSPPTITVAVAPLIDGVGASLSAYVNVPMPANTVVGTFVDSNANDTTTNVTAKVNWGDGSSTDDNVGLQYVGQDINSQSQDLGAKYDVIDTHVYTKTGTFTTTITIDGQTAAQQLAPFHGSVTVSPPIMLSSTLFSEIAGTPFSNQEVGYFTSPLASNTQFTSKITWYVSGSTSYSTAGTVESTGNGSYQVLGGFTYPYSNYTFTFTVSVSAPGIPAVSATGKAYSEDAPILQVGTTDLSGETTTTFKNTVLGTFSHYEDQSSGAANSASLYKATIYWGDGSSSPGTIAAVAGKTGTNAEFTVSYPNPSSGPLHTYGFAGSYTLSVDVSDNLGGTGQLNGTASIQGGALSVEGIPFSAIEGTTLTNVPLATIEETGVLYPFYTAYVNWGDGSGTTSTGITVTGTGEVLVTHTYARVGVVTISVTVYDTVGDLSNSTYFEVTVADAPFVASPTLIEGTQNEELTDVEVATFEHQVPTNTTYAGTVQWGDGTTTELTESNIYGGTSNEYEVYANKPNAYGAGGTYPVLGVTVLPQVTMGSW
jgi:hypothetical protein